MTKDWRIKKQAEEYKDFNDGCWKALWQIILIIIIVIGLALFFNWL